MGHAGESEGADEWFAVRCHFLLPVDPALRTEQKYEERITLWRASTFDEAIQLAEEEALRYIAGSDTSYLNACSAFHLFDGGFGVQGVEVFSEMRQSELEPTAYLDRFFFTGEENSADEPSQPESSGKLTRTQLAAIEARLTSATAGPWEAFAEGRDHDSGDDFIRTGGHDPAAPDMYVSISDEGGLRPARVDDLDFIAHARQDVRRLIDALRAADPTLG